MRTPATLLLLLLCLQELSAQSNFLPGKIVTNTGDSISGYINYRNWAHNPDKIYFKRNKQADQTIYTPASISAFFVNNELYESAVVQKEISPRSASNANDFPDFVLETDTAFVQVLTKGRKSLYYYRPYGQAPNFYISQGDSLQLLLFKKYN